LLDLWREAKRQYPDPVEAWTSLMNDPEKRSQYQQARGKGGFRRSNWDEVLEIISSSLIHTVKKEGSDRIIGFSPIPAMSMLSYAAGSRFLQLLGGVNLSFYDWYSDLPNASPEVWGEQTDVAESADWYNSKYIVCMGANLNMTRTPDVHFIAEARHNGSKFVVLAPDFSQVSRYGDWWIPVNAGQDGALWMAINHVILQEYYVERQVEYFQNYVKKYSDSPFLIILEKKEGQYYPGRMLTAAELESYQEVEKADWKYLVFDANSNAPKMPKGTIGFRWQQSPSTPLSKGGEGQWNLEMKDGLDNSDIDPVLSFLDNADETLQVGFTDFADNERVSERGVPIKYLDTSRGKIAVTTVFDLLMAQFGVKRGLAGEYPENYDDENKAYTPAWQEKFTGIDRKTVIKLAQEWANTAETTEGKCSVIIGAGINHWYHNNLMYRSPIVSLILCGCVGKNGGGLNHYVGQEKLAPQSSWSTLAFALDWQKPPRLQNTPNFHYVHSGQWRYEQTLFETTDRDDLKANHTIDLAVKAVRMGWLPFHPHFNFNPVEVVRKAEADGAKTEQEIKDWIVKNLQSGDLKFAIEDPDAPNNSPKILLIWRGNALASSAKGHEYFLKHYLGTHNNIIAKEGTGEGINEVLWREDAPIGKLDLVVDINFRMDTSALYSDIVLPTATWYEKNDLNSTDMHSYIQPLSAAVPPCWEAKSDWDIFKTLSQKVSELSAKHLPEKLRDVVAVPLQHDTPGEIAQRNILDWSKGECAPIPGKTMPNFVVVERDYPNLYNRFCAFGEGGKNMGMHGLNWSVEDFYQELVENNPTVTWNHQKYPSIADAKDAANVVLHLAPETNGEIAYRAFQAEEKKVGLPLTELAENTRAIRYNFNDLVTQPRRLLTTPCWTGLNNNGRAYSAYCLNVEYLVPWRTLTGRQHLYLDHEGYIAYGENLPTYKPKPDYQITTDLLESHQGGKSLVMNYLTPHGKWHIHSTYGDTLRMQTLSRGIDPLWMNDKDAETLGIVDNDWVEVYNDHGVVVTRAVLSARIPSSICILYHAMERTLGIPKSPLRNNRRGGMHNSLTRIRLKPVLMMGAYGQFSYGFNYWGPTGVNRDTFVLVRKLEGKPQF
jgi:nitrate reductase alpha subunit